MGRFFARLKSLLAGSNPLLLAQILEVMSSILLSVASGPKCKRVELQFIMIPLKD